MDWTDLAASSRMCAEEASCKECEGRNGCVESGPKSDRIADLPGARIDLQAPEKNQPCLTLLNLVCWGFYLV